MTDKSPNLFSFWNELKRRKVVKSALIYLAVAYTIMQASDIIFPRLGLPDWTVTFVIVLLIIVFILVIVLTWVYDITPEGIKVTETLETKPQEKNKAESEKTTELLDIGNGARADLNETDLQQKIETLEGQLKKVQQTAIRPKILWISNLKKFALPIIIIGVFLIVLLFKQQLIQILGIGNAKREIAMSHVSKAVEYIDRGEFVAADAELKLALANDPKNSYAWSSLAAISYKQGDLNKAVMQSLKALDLDPKNAKAAYNMAFAFEDKKQYQLAIEWYLRAIKADSTLVPAYSAAGRLYNTLNNPPDAILLLEIARVKYPESEYLYLVYKNLGNSYLLIDQLDEAIKSLELSIGIKPDEPETNLYLAKAYEASGKMTRSIELWENYIELETDTIKSNEARKHLKEITIRHLQEIIK